MTHPKMMPGQPPYTEAELARVHRAVADAASGDPGELDEPDRPVYCREVVLRYGPRRRAPGPRLASSTYVANFFRGVIGDSVSERFVALALDAKNRPMAWSTIAIGSVESCAMTPGDVLRFPLLAGASRLVVSHNHPSGDPLPSADDIAFTRRLREGARLLGLSLVDHVIVAEADSFSFLDRGLFDDSTDGGSR